MATILTIEQLNQCFVNNTPILFIKKYPEYDLRKEGFINSIDFMTNMILIKVEERIFYKIKFDDVTIYKI